MIFWSWLHSFFFVKMRDFLDPVYDKSSNVFEFETPFIRRRSKNHTSIQYVPVLMYRVPPPGLKLQNTALLSVVIEPPPLYHLLEF